MKVAPQLLQSSRVWSEMSPQQIPATIPATPELIALTVQARRILDVGCASGRLVEQLAAHSNKTWLGVDVNNRAIVEANGRRIAHASFIVHDMLQPLPAEEGFDLAIFNAFFTCLPEISQREKVFDNLPASTQSHSRIYIADFCQTWELACHATRYQQGIKVGLERGSFSVENSEGDVLYLAHHFTREEIRQLLAQAGRKIVSYREFSAITRSGKNITAFAAIAE